MLFKSTRETVGMSQGECVGKTFNSFGSILGHRETATSPP
jgi:hypothetical protein